MTFESAIRLLKELKESANTVLDYEDSVYSGYRNVAEHEKNAIIETLANLEFEYDEEEEANDEDMLPSGCLYIKGYLTHNYDGIPSVSDYKEPMYSSPNTSIVGRIESYAESHGFLREKQTGLGGRQSYIRSCNMRMFFSKKECSLVEAHRRFDAMVYGGDLATDTSYTGYSEWTITGMDLDEFTIGGHNLESEFESHMGEYVHLIIECN